MTTPTTDEEHGLDNVAQKVADSTLISKEQPTTSTTSNASLRIFQALALVGLLWGAIMTGLYVKERGATSPIVTDSLFRADKLGVGAISHINVVVNDSVDIGSAYYQDIFGFEPARNADGLMDYRDITNHGFCVDAGFDECLVDIVFLKHPTIHLYLELFYYYAPIGDLNITLKNTNDAGGIRHVALEVVDAVDTYEMLKSKNHEGTFITKDTPIPLDPFPYTFFYWIDKYGTQWEFEQGRPVEYYHVAGITG